MTQPTVYRIEFGKVGETYPVPPITLEHTDPNEFARKVAAHAIPYLTPVLTAMGRPELADCFFRVDANDPTYGDFLWIDLGGNKAAQFCPARLTPTATEETHVVADALVDHPAP
ncbi:hypothetical protein [Streptomyces sp. NPDC057115]|uniref:hypothetical protein n=1 Tax=Streptomyces sp. NPDC057115 TaxID=3346022 RepID=UPI003630AA9C